MKRLITAVIFLTTGSILPWDGIEPVRVTGAETASATKNYIDVHTHLLGRGIPPQMRASGGDSLRGAHPFSYGPRRGLPDGSFPKGPGRRPGATEQGQGKADYDGAAATLITHMDQNDVEKAIIMPPPQSMENKDVAIADELLRVAKKYPGRLYIALGGSTLNPLIQEYKDKTVTDEIKSRFEAEANRLVGLGIKAFGEMTALHFSIGQGHPFEEVTPDHPLFLLLADIAARSNIPIDLHLEAIVSDMVLPQRLKQGGINPDMVKENIKAFERLMAHNRSAKIVWQHIGRGGPGSAEPTVDLLRRLLNAHPNLYMAVAIPQKREGQISPPTRAVDENGNVRSEWKKLIEDFSDRFVIGSDQFFAKSELQGQVQDRSKATWTFLSQLPSELAQKIGRDNAARIYNLN